MGSKSGRQVQSWMTSGFGRFSKVLLHLIASQHRHLRGADRERAIVAHYERLIPFHQDYWARPRTPKSICGRPNTTRLQSKSREHPSVDVRLSPFLPLALAFLDRGQAVSREELDRLLDLVSQAQKTAAA